MRKEEYWRECHWMAHLVWDLTHLCWDESFAWGTFLFGSALHGTNSWIWHKCARSWIFAPCSNMWHSLQCSFSPQLSSMQMCHAIIYAWNSGCANPHFPVVGQSGFAQPLFHACWICMGHVCMEHYGNNRLLVLCAMQIGVDLTFGGLPPRVDAIFECHAMLQIA